MTPRSRPRLRSARRLDLALALAVPLAAAGSEQTPLTAEQLFARTCRACHQTGHMGAPRLGDRAAWQPLVRQGQAAITAQGWVGLRRMPPRGGDDEATLEEFARVVAYMARAAGTAWPEPTPESMRRLEREVARLEGAKK
jgi:cytochrome c5